MVAEAVIEVRELLEDRANFVSLVPSHPEVKQAFETYTAQKAERASALDAARAGAAPYQDEDGVWWEAP